MDKSFRGLLRQFCLEGSIVGLKYFYVYPDLISRCFWLIAMGVVSLFAGYMVLLLHDRFSELPTRITIESENEPLTDMSYPAITLCSPNQITINAVKHFQKTLVDGNLTFNFEKTLPQLVGFLIPIPLTDSSALENLQTLIDLNRYTVPEVLNSLPQRCDSFLKMCILERKMYPNCQGLFRPILTTFGLCCAFNSVYYLKDNKKNEKDKFFKSHKVQATGHMNGLSVLSDYEPDDAIDRTIMNAGAARVMINDNHEFPSADEMKLVYPYSESFYVLQATYTYCSADVQVLSESSRKCHFTDEQHLPYFGEYRNSDCDQLCAVRAVENECRCTLFFVPNYRTSQACNVSSIPCILKVKSNFYRYSSDGCDCMRDCNFFQYRAEMSLGNLNAWDHVVNNAFEKMFWQVEAPTYNDMTTMLVTRYKSTYMYSATNLSMPMAGALGSKLLKVNCQANLGGVFGLCMGCSAISVVEVVFFSYVYIKNVVNRINRRGIHPGDH